MNSNRPVNRNGRDRLRLVGLVLILPALIVATSFAVHWKFDTDWHRALVDAFGPMTQQELAVASLSRVCADVTAREAAGMCTEYGSLDWLALGGLLTAAVGLGFLGLLWLAGRRARRDPNRILGMFRPALYLAVGTAVILVALDAILTMAALYLAEVAFIGWVSGFLIWGVGGAALLAVIAMTRALLTAARIEPLTSTGRVLDRSDEPRVFGLIADVSRGLGVDPPDNVIVGLEPNFFVTEAPMKTSDATARGRNLYLSTSLARVLTKHELQAVIGHEMAHFAGSDTRWTQAFYPVYRGAASALISLYAATGGLSALASLPGRILLGAFLLEFATQEREIGRERELVADHAGAELAGSMAMATALGKLSVVEEAWDRTLGEVGRELAAGGEVLNVASAFAANVVDNARRHPKSDDADVPLGDPIDTHPPIAARIAALPVSPGEVATVVANVKRRDSAAALFTDSEALEAELSTRFLTKIGSQARAMARAREMQEAATAWVDEFERRRQAPVGQAQLKG